MAARRDEVVAAEEALGLARRREADAAVRVARWVERRRPEQPLEPGQRGHLARSLQDWEQAWGDYLLALRVAFSLCPRKLSAGERWFARKLAQERQRPRRRGASRV